MYFKSSRCTPTNNRRSSLGNRQVKERFRVWETSNEKGSSTALLGLTTKEVPREEQVEYVLPSIMLVNR